VKALFCILAIAACSFAADWTPLFDGKSLDGWTASENKDSWKIVDGQLAADGPRSHLFYTRKTDYKNFEFKADVLTRPGANSGIYFHTSYLEKGWPIHSGFEVQVNNTHGGEGAYRERKKTGSLYGVRNVYKAFVNDDEWFQMFISVRGKRVTVRVNDMLLVDYIEPDPPVRLEKVTGNVLGRGTFALQCHDPKSKVFYKNMMVRELPANLQETVEAPVVDDVYRTIMQLSRENFTLVDYHGHLKGLTIDQLLSHARKTGIQYGVAVNCGLKFPIQDDAGVRKFFDEMKGQPVFLALQGEGREWHTLVSKETAARFDYVFTDAMTFTDDHGKRMRLWIKEEVGEIKDKQAFMEMYVDRILGVLNKEPIDIYVNPTFLPDSIASDYHVLWTPARMQKVVDAAVKNDIAIEINNRYRIPSLEFIQLAKKAGAKFSCGTNNSDANVGRIEYCLEMVQKAGLTWRDIFIPKPEGQKAVQRRAW
jgi:histidinol phosphatase-like PHP family hydrolase